MHTKSYAAKSPTSHLALHQIERREPGPSDVAIKILYCGVCHSDLHTVRGEWPGVMYPSVPGHEIVGEVTAIGTSVSRFNVGDVVAVGCMVDSCGHCGACLEGDENYCENGFTQTYNGNMLHGTQNTYGGYSTAIVVTEKFVFRVSHDRKDLASTAPLLCAGITTWSPLRHWKTGPGKKVGIVGIGGLGHMGVKLAHALGAHVVAFTTSEAKRRDALGLGADEVVNSRDAEAMQVHKGSFDLILNTVAVAHNLDQFTNLLRKDGALVLVGVPSEPHPSPLVFPLIINRRSIAGSLIGGLADTQEMLDFCAEHRVFADVELIRIQDIEASFERMARSDVKYRFVIDMGSLESEALV
jgi:uncharacterized zinc-type alcohol dehydrogenase-like protein